MATRKIIQIDEEKCDGCGECVPACHESAIQIVGGKARLVADVYCDGMGDCLGHCPQGAIQVIEREAAAFDESAVQQRLAAANPALPVIETNGGCPGSRAMELSPPASTDAVNNHAAPRTMSSGLRNWPVQLHLVPPEAPFLQGADLLLVADCVPFAMADFHSRFLNGSPLVIGCPKLDDGQAYVQKLVQIIRGSQIRSITVAIMEVPCCSGLSQIARGAIALAGYEVRYDEVVVSVRGEVIRSSITAIDHSGGGHSPSTEDSRNPKRNTFPAQASVQVPQRVQSLSSIVDLPAST